MLCNSFVTETVDPCWMHMGGSDAVFPTMWLRSATTTMALVDLNSRLQMANLLSTV